MRIGCIYTLKNEEDLIAQNIRYHRYLGVTDFFVFLDYSTDRTRQILQGLPDVRIFENLSYADMLPYSLDKPGLDLELISRRFAEHNGVRQIFHGNLALARCQAEGIDWLINPDPDELICLDPEQAQAGSLKDYLAQLDANVGAVIFRNLEVIPTLSDPRFDFEDVLFKQQLPPEAQVGLPKMAVFNPYSGGSTPAGWFWGHTSGKLGVRVGPEAYFTHLTHLFHTPGQIITADLLLHYNIFSFRQFVNKYRNFKNFPKFTSLGRQVRPLRTLLVDLANDPDVSEAALREYYREHIVYSPAEIQLIRQQHSSALVEIHSAANFFKP